MGKKTVNEKILELRDIALANKKYFGIVFIGRISKEMGKQIKAKCGRDVTGFEMYIDSSYIRHIKNRRPAWLENIDKYVLDIIFNAEDFRNGKKGEYQRIVFIRKTDVEYWAVQQISGKKLFTVTTYLHEDKKDKSGNGKSKNTPGG